MAHLSSMSNAYPCGNHLSKSLVADSHDRTAFRRTKLCRLVNALVCHAHVNMRCTSKKARCLGPENLRYYTLSCRGMTGGNMIGNHSHVYEGGSVTKHQPPGLGKLAESKPLPYQTGAQACPDGHHQPKGAFEADSP